MEEWSHGMSNQSIIEHRANYHYIQVCEEYLLICSHGKASPHCKALILSVLEGWTNTKRDAKQPLDSIYMTYPLWQQSLYYLYSRNIIIECLDELESEKLITRKSQRTPDGKKSFHYGLATEKVQSLIKALPDKSSKDLLPHLDAFKNTPRKTRSNQDAFKSEPQTRSNQDDDAFKLGRNVSSSITSLPKESVAVTGTESQPATDTPTFPEVSGYTNQQPPEQTDTQPSEQLSTQQTSSVDKSSGNGSQQSYSHNRTTPPAQNVGVMGVLEVPIIQGIDEVVAPTVQVKPQAPSTPATPRQQTPAPTEIYTQGARDIRKMYDSIHGIVTGHPEWEWKKMEDMAAQTTPTRDDMQLVYDHLKAKGKKYTIAHVWEAWGELPALKKPVATISSAEGHKTAQQLFEEKNRMLAERFMKKRTS